MGATPAFLLRKAQTARMVQTGVATAVLAGSLPGGWRRQKMVPRPTTGTPATSALRAGTATTEMTAPMEETMVAVVVADLAELVERTSPGAPGTTARSYLRVDTADKVVMAAMGATAAVPVETQAERARAAMAVACFFLSGTTVTTSSSEEMVAIRGRRAHPEVEVSPTEARRTTELRQAEGQRRLLGRASRRRYRIVSPARPTGRRGRPARSR